VIDSERTARAALDAWREQGGDRLDPVRFQFIEALDRRAAAHSGEARRLLNDRLTQLVQDYAADLENAAPEAGDASHVMSPIRPASCVLAALNHDVAMRHAPAAEAEAEAERAAIRQRPYPELEMLDYFRGVWSRVRTQKQLRQSLAQVPGNAGPLNSSSLVHRSLSLMRELSPGYLQQFLSYVETLSWMEQINGGGASTDKEAPRAAPGSARKSTRGKSR
jgi:Protein of unknown function (DUF2894)